MQSVLAFFALTEAQVAPYLGLIMFFVGLSLVLLLGSVLISAELFGSYWKSRRGEAHER